MNRRMDSILKTLLALGLGLGFLAMDARAQDPAQGQGPTAAAKASVAFLGVDPGTDPLYGRALSALIQRDLASDSALSALPQGAVERYLASGGTAIPDPGPADLGLLRTGLGSDYYAFGWLEPMSVVNSRKWWLPWRVDTEWRRDLRLRVLDGRTGRMIFDGKVEGRIAERRLFSGPDAGLSGKAAVERDGCQRRMLPVLSAETAKALAAAVAAPNTAAD